MGGNSLNLSSPSQADLEMLPFWYDLAGVVCEDPREEVEAYARALSGGYLGVAAGVSRRKNLERLFELDPVRWYHARMAVRVLKLNDEPIGMLIMGSHARLWTLLDSRMADDPSTPRDEMSPGFADFMVTALSVAKIHLVAIHPDHQKSGHGSRLLKAALDIARVDDLIMLYGQFGPHRPHLRNFYASKGFHVLQPGEALSIAMATGRAADVIVGDPDDTFFVLQPRRR